MEEQSQKRAVLTVSVITAFLTAFLGSSVNVALPSIEKEFQINAVSLAWISSSYLLATASFLLPFGRISDLIGRKKTFQIGLIFFSFFSFLCGFAPNIQSLIVLRILQGLGSAMIFATSNAIITSVFPQGERGRAMGLAVTGVYFGLTIGPLLGGILTHNIGWRTLFFLNLPIGFLLSYITYTKLPSEWADAKGEKFDFLGSLIYIAGLVLLLLGFSKIQTHFGKIFIILSAILFFLFMIIENKIEQPVLNTALFRKNLTFAFSNLAALINYSATFAVSFLLSLYLQYIKGLSAQSAGFVLAIQPVVQATFSSFAGKLSDRIEPRYVATFGMFLTSLGLFALSFISFNTNLFYIFFSQILLGLGFAFFSSPNTNAIMSSVDKRFLGTASAIVGTMRLIGQTLSLGIVTLFFSLYLGGTQITSTLYPEFLNITQILFIGFAVICSLGMIASLARGNIN
mgnify:CR=1 FL=1